MLSQNLYIPEARECLSCGFCVPRCPTFKQFHNDEESPRGRLRLMDQSLQKEQGLNGKQLAQLDHCLQCGACETICPSKVPYLDLIDSTLAQERKGQRSLIKKIRRFSYRLISRNAYFRHRIFDLLRLAKQLSLLTFIRKSHQGLYRTLATRAHPAKRWKKMPYASSATQRHVGLFIGCMSDVLDQITVRHAIELLTVAGFPVVIPEKQTCCGAVAKHQGYDRESRKLLRKNAEAFSEQLDHIVSIGNACSHQFRRHSRDYRSEDDISHHFSHKVEDILFFLANTTWPHQVRFAPLETTVAVHEPCSLRNGLREQYTVHQLLERIPGIRLQPLGDNSSCCGAGGTHMLEQPEIANPLRDEKIAALWETDTQIVVSSNLSCALHLENGIREADLPLEIMHPISLLHRQWKLACS